MRRYGRVDHKIGPREGKQFGNNVGPQQAGVQVNSLITLITLGVKHRQHKGDLETFAGDTTDNIGRLISKEVVFQYVKLKVALTIKSGRQHRIAHYRRHAIHVAVNIFKRQRDTVVVQ